MGGKIVQKVRHKRYHNFDLGTGHVDFDDFLLSISICCRGTKADKIAVLYQVFDLNEDGLIQKSEIVAMLSNLPNLDNYIQSQPKYNYICPNDLSDADYVSDDYFNDINNNSPSAGYRLGPSSFQSVFPTFSYLDNIPSDTDSSYTLSSESESYNDEYIDENRQYLPHDDPSIPHIELQSPKVVTRPDDITTSRVGTHSKIYDSLMALHFKQGEYDYSLPQGSCCKDSSISGMSRTGPDTDMEEGTPMDMDDLVEKLLEGCEFSENNSLNLLEFKAWLEKNEYIIHMFSECLHEEVWGLQGNAFHLSNRMSPVFKVQSMTPSNEAQDETAIDGSPSNKGDCQLTLEDYNKIKNLFTIDIKQSYGLNAIDRSKRVVSEEIVEHMKTTMNKKVEIHTRYTRKNSPICLNNFDAFHRDADLLSCPSCKTPYLLCFKCHSRYRSLHLVIYPTQIYIECETCLLRCDPAYTSCWICAWQFDQALHIINLQSPVSNKSARRIPIDNLDLTASVNLIDANSSDSQPSQMSRGTRDSFGGSMQSVISTVENALDSGTITVSNIGGTNVSGSTPNSGPTSSGFKRPIMSGILYKIGKHLHQWKARYYVLVDNILYYYADRYSSKPRGCIFLEGCYLDNVSERNGTIYEGKYGFSICHKGKKYSRRDLYANSKEKMQMWIDSLTLAMKQQSLTEMYQMCEQLGHGKFSVVYRGVHKQTDMEYAIKIIDKRLITAQERELLRCEMAILRLLRHRNVIFLKDIIDTKDSLYIIMEFVRGGELYNFLYSGQRLTEMHTHKIVIQLLETVSYLHKCGIVHRDIKPENILLTDKTPEATIKLTDFGLSTLCGPSEKLTQPCGTLAYVAPEVLTLEGYNHKVDSWSIGVVMYLLIRGRLPFSINHRSTTKPEVRTCFLGAPSVVVTCS